jgi:hypothetical protein
MLQTYYTLLFAQISRKSALLLFVLCLFFYPTYGQQETINPDDQALKDLIESLAPDLPEDYDLSELLESLTYLHKHPINLNNTSPEALKALVFLSPLQISNLFQHIKTNGKLLDLLELQSIEGFDVLTVQRIMPFVKVAELDKEQHGIHQLFRHSEQQFIMRYGQTLEKQKGFNELQGSHYLGSPERLLAKYKYSYNDLISASLVLEKDAGEHLFSSPQQKGFDFMSGNISLRNLGMIRKLVVGDYSLQFGQGLTLWSGFGFGKGPDVTSVAKKDFGLKPYSSSNESSYFRGIATTLRLIDRLELTSFVSRTRQDASTKTDEDGNVTQINIGVSGLHRTSTELKNRNTLEQSIYGSALQYTTTNLSIGLVGYTSHFSNAFVTGPLAYNRYNFTGNQLSNLGAHYNYTFQNIYFYGEIAKSFPGGYAAVNGAMASLSRSLSLVLVNRSYGKDHHNFLARSLGEGSEASNEKGWYSGLNYIPNKRWSFSVYGDFFKFPWLKYRIDSASTGYDLLSQAAYTPVKTFKVVLRVRSVRKQQNSDLQADSTISNVLKTNYRIGVNWALGKHLNLENRFEVVNYKKDLANELGYLAYQDLDYRPAGSKVSGNMRLAYFRTASYNSRLYAYEDDVLYSSGFGMYNGKGLRSYLNLQYKFSNKLTFWTRYAVFLYQDAETVGSGLDMIEGNKKMDLKFQLRYAF